MQASLSVMHRCAWCLRSPLMDSVIALLRVSDGHLFSAPPKGRSLLGSFLVQLLGREERDRFRNED